jgi:hypothetical protein
MKSLLMGTGHYLCKVYNYDDSRACSYKWFGILFSLDGMVWDGWNGFGVDHVDWCDFGPYNFIFRE